MVDIVEKITEQIAYHRAELLRLESALEVIAAVAGKPIKSQTPMITVRKTTTPSEAPTPRHRFKYTPQEIANAIIADLKTNGPSKSSDIGKRITEYTDGLNKRLWGALYAMKKDRILEVDDSKRYFLAAAAGANDAQAAA